MFKRVQKRQRKQEKEEELGLDSEMKEVLGLQDTDSEESDSSSDEGSTGSDDEEDLEGDESAEEDSEQALDVEDEEGSEASEEEDEFPPMSVTEAVSDPLYLVSMDPKTRACILCPGKLLKNPRMADVHKSSKAHSRRFTHFVELVSKAGPDGDVRDLLRALNEEVRSEPRTKAAEDAVSKRAEKRKAKLATLKAKRAKHKQIAARKQKQAERAKASGDNKKPPSKPAPGERPQKKRKLTNSTKVVAESPSDDESHGKLASSATHSEPKVEDKPSSKSTKSEESLLSGKPSSNGSRIASELTKSQKSKASNPPQNTASSQAVSASSKPKKARHRKTVAA